MTTDWLKPKVYKPENQNGESVDEKLEHTLLDIQKVIDEVVAEQEKLRSLADDRGQFGEYRFRDGMIAGLNYAKQIVDDWLAGIWGM